MIASGCSSGEAEEAQAATNGTTERSGAIGDLELGRVGEDEDLPTTEGEDDESADEPEADTTSEKEPPLVPDEPEIEEPGSGDVVAEGTEEKPAEQRCGTTLEAALASGREVYASKGLCANCHGGDGSGSPLGPALTDDKWIHIIGDVASIAANIRSGVADPVDYPTPMPPMGGAKLTDAEICALAEYVATLKK